MDLERNRVAHVSRLLIVVGGCVVCVLAAVAPATPANLRTCAVAIVNGGVSQIASIDASLKEPENSMGVTNLDGAAVSEGGVEISAVAPNEACIGTIVKIIGSGFGTEQGSSVVKFNGIDGIPTRWSSTTIEVPVPAGAASGRVAVIVDGQSSNSVQFVVSCRQAK